MFGVNQTTPTGNTATVAGTSSDAISANITNATGEWVVDIIGEYASSSNYAVPNSPQTLSWSIRTNSDGENTFMSRKSATGTTTDWTTTINEWNLAAVVIKAQ